MDPSPLPTDLDWRADILTRVGARLLDGVILAVPTVALLLAFGDLDLEAGRTATPVWVAAATVVMAALYEIVLIAMSGQTIGKRVLGIQVVDVVTGRPPRLSGATLRYLVPGVPSLLPVPGAPLLGLLVWLSATWSPTRQGWHDRAAGTVVVRTAARQAVTGGWAGVEPPQERR